jgi:hypothetical protein
MRLQLFWILILTTTAASAGALESCRTQKHSDADVQLCVETAQLRSTNQLRKLSTETRAAVSDETHKGERRSRMREYRRLEARHVRERNTLCRKQTSPLERDACVADMNEAHAAELRRFME